MNMTSTLLSATATRVIKTKHGDSDAKLGVASSYLANDIYFCL